jgi:hypothetical protein
MGGILRVSISSQIKKPDLLFIVFIIWLLGRSNEKVSLLANQNSGVTTALI